MPVTSNRGPSVGPSRVAQAYALLDAEKRRQKKAAPADEPPPAPATKAAKPAPKKKARR